MAWLVCTSTAMTQLAAAGGAVGLTALVSCAAERLAQQRVALDAVDADDVPPAWPPALPRPSQSRPRPIVHVYWPIDARAPGTVYGWRTNESVVVACVHPDTKPRAWTRMPRVRALGRCLRMQDAASEEAWLLVRLDARHMPHMRLRSSADVCVLLYTPPNVLRGQSLEVERATSAPCTRLEYLLAMDATRRDDMRSSSPRLRSAIDCMNVASFACTCTPIPKQCARLGFPRLEMLRRASAYSLLCHALYRRLLGWGAWCEYRALWNAVRHELEFDGRVQSQQAMQKSMHACWSAWLMTLVDVALGCLLAGVMEAHSAEIHRGVEYGLACVGHASFHALFHWLAHWPLGIKLNDELALFLSDALGSVSALYTYAVLEPAAAHISTALRVCAWTGCFGASMALGVCADALRVGTLHVRLMYGVLRRVYVFFVGAASELFDVFRSRKRNPLHGGRLDHAEHEVDQLFVGTILFTLLAFLFPTVLLFYWACAARFFVVHAMHTALVCVVRMLYDTPLYTLFMRFWDAASVSDGIVLQTHGVHRIRARPVSVHDACRPIGEHAMRMGHLVRDAYHILQGIQLAPT